MGILKNIKHEKFAQGIVKGMTIDAAYVAAGYKPNDSNASRLNGNDRIRARVAELAEGAAKRAAKNLDDVIAEYERIAFTGMSKFIRFDSEGNPQIDLSTSDPADLDLIAEAQTVVKRQPGKGRGKDKTDDVEFVTVKIKPMDRLKALEKLGAHLGMGDKAANQSTDRLADAIRAISFKGSAAPMRKLKYPKK